MYSNRIIRALAMLALSGAALAHTETIYVATTGSDSAGTGTSTSPYATISYVCQQKANPGDTVLVRSGIYTAQANAWSQTLITRSGTSASWITIRSEVQHGAILKSNRQNGVRFEAAKYVSFEGFDVTVGATPHADGDGISVNVNGSGVQSHHIKIKNCKVHDFHGGGIMVYRADYATIDNNLVYGNAKVSTKRNSGISFYQMTDSEPVGQEFTGYKNFIRNNRCWDNVQLQGNITDGNGIIVDDGRHTQKANASDRRPYKGRTRVENNVCHYNGGRGIHVFISQHVDVVFNTVFKNQSHNLITDGELVVNDIGSTWDRSDTDVKFHNNIAYARTGKRAKPNATNFTEWNGQLYFNCLTVGTPGTNYTEGQDPLFVNSSQSNFRLQSSSPAIDAASGFTTATDFDGNARPIGSGYDKGAFENQSPSGTAPAGNG